MNTGNTPRDEEELKAFLDRQSSISTDYDTLELVEPSAALDAKILAVAKGAAASAKRFAEVIVLEAGPEPAAPTASPVHPVVAAPAAGASPAIPSNLAQRRKGPRPPPLTTDDAPPSRRPTWLVPAALAASVLVAVGVGLTVVMDSPSGKRYPPLVGALFAQRARDRAEAYKAAAAAAAEQNAKVVLPEAPPLPSSPLVEPEGPQIQDLKAAIAMIRKELVRVNQTVPATEEVEASQGTRRTATLAARDKQLPAPAGNLTDAAPAVAPAAPPSVIQPRERRLGRILELYDGGNPDLAADSLEIFLRDFADDPISQRIIAVKP